MFALATLDLITPWPLNCHKVKVFRLWKIFFTKIWSLFVIIWQTFATASALTTFILCAPKPQILKDKKTDCLRFVMCPLLEPGFQDFFFFTRPSKVLMKQTRQPVHTIKQCIYLDVYALNLHLAIKKFFGFENMFFLPKFGLFFVKITWQIFGLSFCAVTYALTAFILITPGPINGCKVGN